jgi:hypothetical protein
MFQSGIELGKDGKDVEGVKGGELLGVLGGATTLLISRAVGEEFRGFKEFELLGVGESNIFTFTVRT